NAIALGRNIALTRGVGDDLLVKDTALVRVRRSRQGVSKIALLLFQLAELRFQLSQARLELGLLAAWGWGRLEILGLDGFQAVQVFLFLLHHLAMHLVVVFTWLAWQGVYPVLGLLQFDFCLADLLVQLSLLGRPPVLTTHTAEQQGGR